jgi:hypothetical protein
LLNGDSGRYIKENFGNRHLSLYRGTNGKPEGGFAYWGLCKTAKQLSINGASLSLSLSLLCEGHLGGRVPLLGILKAT